MTTHCQDCTKYGDCGAHDMEGAEPLYVPQQMPFADYVDLMVSPGGAAMLVTPRATLHDITWGEGR